MTVENTKAITPAITELESKVSKTLIPTLPHRIVVSKKLESCRNLATLRACGLFLFDSISNWSLEILKQARFSPENMADCVMQKKIPIHIIIFIIIPKLK